MVKAEFIGISSFGSPLRRSLRCLRLRTEMTLRDIPVFRSAYSASRNARAPAASRPPVGGGANALPFLRTGMTLRDIPVFRMAYFTLKPHCGLISKTLMLQVRFAHPPVGGGLTLPPFFAPECFSKHPVFRSAYFPIPHRPTFGAPVFRSAYSTSRNARAPAASRPPSSHTVAFSPKRSTFRFAPLTLRLRTEMTLRDIPVFRSAYSASRNARAPAASRPSVGGGELLL